MWLQSSTRELQWLEYLKTVFLKIPNMTSWSVFRNQVTIIICYCFHFKSVLYAVIIAILSWTTLVVHNRYRLEIQGKTLIERTQTMPWKQLNAFILEWKTFCGILLCCLDVSAIIKRSGIEFHDVSLIVKYTHFSILLI